MRLDDSAPQDSVPVIHAWSGLRASGTPWHGIRSFGGICAATERMAWRVPPDMRSPTTVHNTSHEQQTQRQFRHLAPRRAEQSDTCTTSVWRGHLADHPALGRSALLASSHCFIACGAATWSGCNQLASGLSFSPKSQYVLTAQSAVP
jgi:hypothetical protein